MSGSLYFSTALCLKFISEGWDLFVLIFYCKCQTYKYSIITLFCSLPHFLDLVTLIWCTYVQRNSTHTSCERNVHVKALSKIKYWELSKEDQLMPLTVRFAAAIEYAPLCPVFRVVFQMISLNMRVLALASCI